MVIRLPAADAPFSFFLSEATIVAGISPKQVRDLEAEAGGQEALWFRQAGKDYWIRDPELITRARTIFAGQLELAAEQARLGAQQAELGQRQRELGAQQAELGQLQRELGAQQADLARQPETPPIVARQDEIGERQDEIGSEQERIGQEQTEIGERQTEIGLRQTEIGKQQTEMGRQEAEKLQTILTEAVSSGRAEPAGR